MINTACGLDCYDGCSIVYDNDKVSGDKMHPVTQGALCANINKNIFKAPRITTPMINAKKVSMSEALEYVANVLSKKTLLWRGSGSVGVMQEITNLLIEKIDGTITKGSWYHRRSWNQFNFTYRADKQKRSCSGLGKKYYCNK